MKKITLLMVAMALCVVAFAQEQTQVEPTRIRIGETILTLQSPLRVQSAAHDTIESVYGIFVPKTQTHRSYPRYGEELYFGFGLAVPVRGDTYLPIHSGCNSFNLEVGYRYIYRPSKYYAIGTFLQYSCYSYRMKDASEMFMGSVPPGTISKEFFRTDNIGTGVMQRIRLFRFTQLEAIVYGDWAYSKRFIVKSRVDNHKEKTKYRDDIKFNPFGAGAQVGITLRSTTLYARYRFTHFFNHDYIPNEVPRLSIGMSFGL